MSRYEKQLRRKNRKEKKYRRHAAYTRDPIEIIDGPDSDDPLFAIDILDYLFPPDIYNAFAAVCEITNKPIVTEYNRIISETFGDIQDDLRQTVTDDPARAKGILEQMLERLPDHPMLLNWLASCHARLNDWATAGEMNQRNLSKNPDYLFARVGAADYHVLQKDFDRALAAMGGSWDLKTIFPDRTVFHVTEVEATWSVAAKFYLATGDTSKSGQYIGAVICVNPESDLVKMAMKSLSRATARHVKTDDRITEE